MRLSRSLARLLPLTIAASAMACAIDGSSSPPPSQNESQPDQSAAAPRATHMQVIHTENGERTIRYAIVDDKAIIEGDIAADIDENGMVVESSLYGQKWPNGVIPYAIDSALPQDSKDAANAAVKHWNANTNVQWTLRTNQTDYVNFTVSASIQGCGLSPFGKKGGAQSIYLRSGCGFGTAVHEMGHAAGLAHEQSRNDAKLWVNVSQTNSNDTGFATDYGLASGSTDVGMYDYDSIMQYPSCSGFAVYADCRTNTAHRDIEKTNLDLILGQTSSLSAGDISGIRTLYGGHGLGFQPWTTTTNVGSANWPRDIAVARNNQNQQELFVRTNAGLLIHSRNGGAWETLGTITSAPVVAMNRARGLEVFARGADGTLGHAYQDTNTLAMSTFYSFGFPIVAAPGVGMNTDGNLEVFAIEANGQLYHIWATNNGAAPWSAAYSLGGTNLTGVPAVAQNQDGRLEVFASTTSGRLQHIWAIRNPAAPWSGWLDMNVQATSDASVALNYGNGLEVFVRGVNGDVQHAWQTWTGSSGFSAFESLGGAVQPTTKPIATVNADGGLQVFTVSGGAVSYRYHTFNPSSPWSNTWTQLGSGLVGTPAIGHSFSGRLAVYEGSTTSNAILVTSQ